MAFSVLNKNERVTDKDDMEVTPWQNDNENGLTISEVDKQDEKSLEDWLDDAENTDFDSSIVTNTLSQLVSQNGIYTAINRIKNAVTGGDEKTSHRPGTTVSEEADELGQRLKKLKAGKYPNMHIYLTSLGIKHIKNNILPVIELEDKVLNSMSEDEFERLIIGSSKYIGIFKDHVANFIIRER